MPKKQLWMQRIAKLYIPGDPELQKWPGFFSVASLVVMAAVIVLWPIEVN